MLDGYKSSLPADEAAKEDNLGTEIFSNFVQNAQGPKMAFAWSLALNPFYRNSGGRRNMRLISDSTNQFHNSPDHPPDYDSPIISVSSFESLLDEYKSSLPANEALKEDRLQKELYDREHRKKDYFHFKRDTLRAHGLWPS